MDKYEYQLKLDQINKLIERNDYATALKIADNIDWRRVRSVNTLSKIADVYEKNEKYEESRDLLLMAYDRAPVGRMIAYRLSDMCIRLGDYDQAIEYYKDFVHSAPKDPGKLILKYKIFRGKGAALKDQIAILEEYRAQEYEEQWALELAYLYEEAGEIEKCVNECDELILWFNDGQYVIRAMELKMKYAQLTPAQQEKYEIRMNRTKLVDAQDEPKKAAKKKGASSSGQQQPYEMPYLDQESYERMVSEGLAEGYPQEEVLPEIQDPETLPVQEELRMDEDGQLTLEMPEYQPVEKQITGQMTIQEILAEWEKAKQPMQAEAEAPGEPKEAAAPEAEEPDGAEEIPQEDVSLGEEEELPEISMPDFGDEEAEEPTEDEVPEGPIEDEKPEEPIEEDNPGKEASEAEEPDGAEEIPQEDVGLGEEEELPEISMPDFGDEEPEEPIEDEEPEEPKKEVSEAEEPDGAEEIPQEDVDLGEEEELPEISMPDFGDEEPEEPIEDEEPETAETSETNEFADFELPEGFDDLMEEELPEIAMPEEDQEQDLQEEVEIPALDIPEEFMDQNEETAADEDEMEEPDETDDAADDLESRIVNALSRDSLALADADDGEIDGRIGDERIRRESGRRVKRGRREKELTEDQKKMFTYFAPVHGMSDQLWMALENEKSCIRGGTSNIGNVMITGEPGSGKTMLAVNLIKAIQKSRNQSSGRLAKISAETLNEKDVAAVVKKLSGGALIIERASEMTNETAMRLEMSMKGQTGELLIVFEDEKQLLKRFMKMHPKLAAMCTTKIDIPIFNNDELVEFGKCYAHELEYSIDEMAVLALYNRIGNMQRDDYDVSVTDVKKIIDAAIEKNEKGGVGKFFSVLTKKRYDDEDCIILREKDFEE